MRIPNKLNIAYNVALPNGKRISESAESNAVSTEILTYSVDKTLRSDKTVVRAGETVRNTVTVTNRSDTKLFRNFVTISQPDGASFVADSVRVNGIEQPTYDPVAGFALPDLHPDETVVIEYTLKADHPTTEQITHFATLRYTVNDPARGDAAYSENTNSVSIAVLADTSGAVIPAFRPQYDLDPEMYYRLLRDCEYGCDCCNCRNCSDESDCCDRSCDFD